MTVDELLQDPATQESGPIKVSLLRGPIYSDDPHEWARVLQYEEPLGLYFAQIGLELKINKDFGYAYLDQYPEESVAGKFGVLFNRRALGFEPTVIGVTLRDELLDREVTRIGDGGPVVMTVDEIVNRVQAFLQEKPDQVKERERWKTAVKKFAELGFIKQIDAEKEEYQLRPILNARFGLETLTELKEALIKYAGKSNNATNE